MITSFNPVILKQIYDLFFYFILKHKGFFNTFPRQGIFLTGLPRMEKLERYTRRNVVMVTLLPVIVVMVSLPMILQYFTVD